MSKLKTLAASIITWCCHNPNDIASQELRVVKAVLARGVKSNLLAMLYE